MKALAFLALSIALIWICRPPKDDGRRGLGI